MSQNDPLAAFPALEDLPPAALQPLRDAARTASYPEGHVLSSPEPVVRFVLSGQVEVDKPWPVTLSARRRGPGSVLGLDGLARWSGHGETGPALLPSRTLTRAPTEVLEVPLERFDRAFGHPGRPGPLLARLLAVHAASRRERELVDALAAEPRLANAREQDLLQLLEGSFVERGSPVLRVGDVPKDFYVLLEGGTSILRDGERLASLQAPACIGLKQFLLGREMAGDAELSAPPARWRPRDPVAVRISGQRFNHLRATRPDFDRAVRRGSHDELWKHRPPPRYQVLVLAGAAGLPMGALARLLAEGIAARPIQDHVLLVRVTKDGAREEARLPWRPDEEGKGWVAEVSRPLPAPGAEDGKRLLEPGAALAWAKLKGEALAGEVNVALVDASAAGPEAWREVLARLVDEVPRGALKLVYLARTAADCPAADALPEGVEVVFCGLLDAALPTGIGLALRKLRKRRATLLGALREAAGGAPSLLRAAGEQVAHALSPLQPAEGEASWPLGTVRVRLPREWVEGGEVPAALALAPEAVRESVKRWGRGATGRRVGLALGGGGAFGYVHIALINRLLERGLPIDLVSGSSFGAVVGAYYCGAGREGLELLEEHWIYMWLASLMGVVTSAGIGWGIDFDLGPRDLAQLEVPLLPVVTDADTGVEWDVREGTVGTGGRASGSLPPVFGPTLLGNRRFLDGGIVANVPVNVLRDEGAAVIVASNPISRVSPRRRALSTLPLVGRLWAGLDPLTRVEDSLRMLTLLGRTAGESQQAGADTVRYQPKFTAAHVMAFRHARRIVAEAKKTFEVAQAVLDCEALWRATLNNPDAWVREVKDEDGVAQIELVRPLLFSGDALDETSLPLLAELVELLHDRPDIEGFKVTATAADRETAEARAEAVRAYLAPRVPQQRIDAGGIVAAHPAGPESRVWLVDVDAPESFAGMHRKMAELQEALRGQLEEARRSQAGARFRALVAHAHAQCRSGDLELARLLALEAAQDGASPEADHALREVLERKGQVLRSIEEGGAATCLAWSPDGKRLAVGTKDGKVRLWDAGSGKRIGLPLSQEGGTDPGVNALAFDPSGARLASCGNDFTLKLWDVTGKPEEPAWAAGVGTWDHWGLAFSPSGRWLLGPAGGQHGRSAALVAVASGRGAALGVPVRQAAWAPDGERFATAGGDAVVLWQAGAEGAAELARFEAPGARSVAWHPRRDAVVYAAGKTAQLQDLGGAAVALEGHSAPVEQVAFSHDGRWLLTVSPGDRTARVWEGGSGRLRMVLRFDDEGVRGAAWHPSSDAVVAWGGMTARVFDAPSGQLLALLTGHAGEIQQGAWSPAGDRLATASVDGTARIWDAAAGGPEAYQDFAKLEAAVREVSLPGQAAAGWYAGEARRALGLAAGEGGAAWVELSPDRAWAAAAPEAPSEGGPMPVLWKASARRGVAPRKAGAPEVVLHWSPDSRRLAAREGGRITVWEPGSAERLAEAALEGLVTLAWQPGSEQMACALWRGGGQAVWLWRPGEKPRRLPGADETDGVWHLAWSRDGKRLATACNDARVRVYDVERGEQVGVLTSRFAVRRVAFSPDGQLLATGDDAERVSIWTAGGEDLVASPQPRRSRIQELVWSPDGKCLFSASEAGQARVWRKNGTGAWAAVAVLEAAPALRWAAFSGDSRWVAVMGQDGLARLHAIDFGALVERVARRPGRNELTLAERTLYLGGEVQRWQAAHGDRETARPQGAVG